MNNHSSLKFLILAFLKRNSFVVEYRGADQQKGNGDEDNGILPCATELLKDLQRQNAIARRDIQPGAASYLPDGKKNQGQPKSLGST